MGKLIDLTGKQFHRWTVIQRVSNSKWNKPRWLCKCDCGTIKTMQRNNLCNGNTQSCGCLQKDMASKRFLKDLTGMTFNSLTVMFRKNVNDNQNKPIWICKCICGNITEVDGPSLKSDRTKSCGCLKKMRLSKRPFEYLYNKLLHTSKTRPYDCTLTYEQYLTFTNTSSCYYCGNTILWKAHNIRNVTNGYNLDRIDSNKGYSIDNCVVCCGKCNQMKMAMSQPDFINHCKQIVEWYAVKNN